MRAGGETVRGLGMREPATARAGALRNAALAGTVAASDRGGAYAVPGGNRTGLAWMVTAGVAMAVGDRATLDLAWRYTYLGKVRTDRGRGRVVWRDGSRDRSTSRQPRRG